MCSPVSRRINIRIIRQPFQYLPRTRTDTSSLDVDGGAVVGDEVVAGVEVGGEVVGELIVGLRPGEARLDPGDARVLDLVSAPIAAAVQAVALAEQLRSSREQVITAREEERRRLRRDLHDGLGPVLTGVVLNAEAALRRLAAHRGIVLCDGQRLPLPMLWHHAAQPSATGVYPRDLVSEFLRLIERAVIPLQGRLEPDLAADCLRLNPNRLDTADVDDLLYVQDELSDAVLERYDKLDPGRLERRSADLAKLLVRTQAA